MLHSIFLDTQLNKSGDSAVQPAQIEPNYSTDLTQSPPCNTIQILIQLYDTDIETRRNYIHSPILHDDAIERTKKKKGYKRFTRNAKEFCMLSWSR